MDFVNYDNTDIESNLLVDANSPGLMSAADKDKLDSILNIVSITQKEYDNLETKDPNTLYLIKPLTSTLVTGLNFNDTLGVVGSNATSVVFTKTAIPSDKISSAVIVSTEDSDVNAYMYLDGDTIYVSPEEDNTIIYANENCTLMFNDCSSLTSLDLSNFDTSKVSSMYNMFNMCYSLTSLDVSNWNTSKVTNMSSMFHNCESLTSLDVSNFNTSNVTNMSEMFSRCGALTSLDVSNFNTSKVTNMDGMFNACASLTSLDLSNFDTSNVTSMAGMFGACASLTSLDVSSFNTSKVTNMSYMFYGCNLTSLDVSNFDTSNVTDMSYMFYYCNKLTSLDLSNWDTSKVTNMGSMFSDCSSLTSLDLSNFDTSNVTDMSYMFNNCSKAYVDITIMNPNTEYYESMFTGCSTDTLNASSVRYIDDATHTIAQNMVATKSSNSRVYVYGGGVPELK